MTRIVRPDRRTLPSRTDATFSLCATVAMSGCSPWNENDDVRAATCSPSMRESESSNSSVSPSEKYSWLGSPLMFTNGSTAMEWGGGEKATALIGAAFAGSPDCDGASTRTPVTLAPERARQSA